MASSQAASLFAELRRLAAPGNAEDDRLIATLTSLSRLVLRGDSDALEAIREALAQKPPDPALVPYLLVLRSLHRDSAALGDIQPHMFSSADLEAFYAVASVILLGTQPIHDDLRALQDLWEGALTSLDIDPGLRPSYMDHLKQAGRVPRGPEILSNILPVGCTWEDALQDPKDPTIRSVVVQAATGHVPDRASLLAFRAIEGGPEVSDVARRVLMDSDLSKPVERCEATGELARTPGSRALLMSLAEKESDPAVLANIAANITEYKDESNSRDTIEFLRGMAERCQDNRDLADRIAQSLSAMDSPDSLAALSQILRTSPSKTMKIGAITQLARFAFNCSTVQLRRDAIADALSEVDPDVSSWAVRNLLFLSQKSQAPLEDDLAQRIRHAIETSAPPQERDGLVRALEGLPHRK